MIYVPPGGKTVKIDYYVIGFDKIYSELTHSLPSSDNYDIGYIEADATTDISDAKGVVILQAHSNKLRHRETSSD